MFCAYTRPRYQVSVFRTIGPLVQSRGHKKLRSTPDVKKDNELYTRAAQRVHKG